MQRPIYNPTDDYLYGFKNGQWVKSGVRLFLNAISVFLDGVFGVPCALNKKFTTMNVSQFNLSSNHLVSTATASNSASTVVTSELVDVTNYAKMKVVTTDSTVGTQELNISLISGTCYPYCSVYNNGAGIHFTMGLCTSLETIGANDLISLPRVTPNRQISIKEIILE
jgi:hypothetical protein